MGELSESAVNSFGTSPNVVEDPLVAAIIDGGQNAEGAVIELIGSHIPRKSSQGPVQEVGVHARLRLFSPRPRPSSGSWQKGRRRGGRARGANSRADRAGRPRPPAGLPDPSRGACTDRRAGRDRRGPRESTCDTSYSNTANTFGNGGNPFSGIGSIRPRTEHDGVLRARMLRPALYDKCPSGAIPKPGNDAIVSNFKHSDVKKDLSRGQRR